jgi:hypothetical protein
MRNGITFFPICSCATLGVNPSTSSAATDIILQHLFANVNEQVNMPKLARGAVVILTPWDALQHNILCSCATLGVNPSATSVTAESILKYNFANVNEQVNMPRGAVLILTPWDALQHQNFLICSCATLGVSPSVTSVTADRIKKITLLI